MIEQRKLNEPNKRLFAVNQAFAKYNGGVLAVLSVTCWRRKIVEYDWVMIGLLFVGGMLVTGSANAINQVVERETDAMMKRTAKRPMAAGSMSVEQGWAFAIVSGAIGVCFDRHITLTGCRLVWLLSVCSCMHLFIRH